MRQAPGRALLPRAGLSLCLRPAIAFSATGGLRPQVNELQGLRSCRDHSLSHTKKGRRDSWRQQQNRNRGLSRWGRLKAVGFGNSMKASTPPVELQLQERHSALAPVRANIQQGTCTSASCDCTSKGERQAAVMEGFLQGYPCRGYGGTCLLTWPGILEGWCLLEDRMLLSDFQGLHGLLSTTLLLFPMGMHQCYCQRSPWDYLE